MNPADHLKAALAGEVQREVSDLDEPENLELREHFHDALEVYVPQELGGNIVGAYEIYQDLAPVHAVRPPVWGVVFGGFALLMAALLVVVRAAATLICRQQQTLEPGYLKLEITESVAMQDTEATGETLRPLKALGVGLAIDDFGTGYSSLAYLKRLPVDALKIDRSFVDGLGQDPHDTAIVQSVVMLARAVGLSVTAEAIETEGQCGQQRLLGCNRGRGFLFAVPQSTSDVETLISAPGARDRSLGSAA